MLSTPETLKQHINGRLLAHSNQTSTRAAFVQPLAHQPREDLLVVPAVAEPLLVWVVSGSVRVSERDIGSDWLTTNVSSGSFYLTHSANPYEMRWHAETDDPFIVLHVYLGLAVYRRALADVFGKDAAPVSLADVSGERDPTVSHLMELIHDECAASSGPSEMLIEGLAFALAVHVVRTYAIPVTTRRSRRQTLQVFKLQRSIRQMEAGLSKPFNLESLATEAGLSSYHFSRMFKETTGFSPSSYFIQLKMARARHLLRGTSTSVVSIAMQLGYSSPSHFAHVFKREVGVSPRDYRM